MGQKLDNYDITPIKEQDLVVNDVYEAVKGYRAFLLNM